MSDHMNEDILIEDFVSALEAAPNTRAHIVSREARAGPIWADFLVEIQVGDVPILLVVEAKRMAFPRDVREASWKLGKYLDHMSLEGKQAVPVIVAETISPGARSLLREEGVGYYDTSGSLYVPARGVYLYVEKPIPKRQARTLGSLFVGRRAQVLHAVWLCRGNWFGVHEIAERASVSPTTVSQTLIALERREWVVTRGSGPTKERRVSNPQALLDAWSTYQTSAKPKPMRHYYVRSAKVGDLVHRLDQVCEDHDVPYEITGSMAGQIHAPYLSSVSQVQCRLAQGAASEAVLDMIEARPVREGWNLGILDAKSPNEFVFRERINGVWVADPLQTYLDLLQAGGRSKELADHLRAERLNT